MSSVALVVAGGKGSRMGLDTPKQFLKINDKEIIYYTLKKFNDSPYIDKIVLVTSNEYIDFCKDSIVKNYNLHKVVSIVEGGTERHESVYNGLIAIEECDIVLIHDVARPFIDDSIIKNGIEYAKEYGASACGVYPKDTIKSIQNNFSAETLNRNELFMVQTPQCFKYDLILNCHKNIDKDKRKNITDDTMVVEHFNNKVYLYEGSYKNIKITTKEDLIVAKCFIDEE